LTASSTPLASIAVCFLTYEQGVEALRASDWLSDSDRATLMGGTVQRVYKWSPANP
jgi:hypothetical protein